MVSGLRFSEGFFLGGFSNLQGVLEFTGEGGSWYGFGRGVVSGGEICAFKGNRTRKGTSVGGLLNNGNTGLTRVGLVKVPIPPKFAVAASIYARCGALKHSGIIRLLGSSIMGTVTGMRTLVGSGFNSVSGPLLMSIHSNTHTSVPNVVSAVLGLNLGSRIMRNVVHGANGTHFT